ncbi:MAG: hypothetical protein AAF267_18395 [Deinococcota bacterium]
MGWVWVLIPLTALSIPIIAILSSMFEKIIKAQQQQAGPVIEELTADLAALREQNQRYEQRITNLEEVVIAQVEYNQQSLPAADERYPMPDLGTSNEGKNGEKIASMIKQLKG